MNNEINVCKFILTCIFIWSR